MFKLLFVSAIALVSLPVAAQARSAEGEAPAEAASPVTVSGSAVLTSDYRFRGISQTNEQIAVQGGVTIAHESGLYIGTWGSNLAGWGTFGGANVELDLIAGYKHKLSGNMTLDVGAIWYMYPGGADKSDFVEPYAKLTGTTGPATFTVGAAYAPAQEALGRWYLTGADAAAGIYDAADDKEDNLYLWGDGAVAIGGTPITAKAHIGYSSGNEGLGPNGTSLTPTGSYLDWSLGADAAFGNLTLGVAWIDTDISDSDAAYLRPSFSNGQDGTGNIAGSTVVASLTAAF